MNFMFSHFGLLCCLLGSLSIFTNAVAQSNPLVEVFSDHAIAVSDLPGYRINYFNLAEPEAVKTAYLPILPPNPVQAKSIMTAFMQSEKGRLFQQKIREAYRGHQLMVSYQLEKIPAIVFDKGRYVVYGTTDVRQALMIYRSKVDQEPDRSKPNLDVGEVSL